MQRSFSLPVNIRQSAATTAGNVVWAMRNLSQYRALWVRRIDLNAMFDGAPATSTSVYRLLRFTTATPTAGTAITPVPINTRGASPAPASIVTDARFLDTGLTQGAMAYPEDAFALVGAPRAVGAVAFLNREWGDFNETRRLVVPPGEGIAIRLGLDAVVGDTLQGNIEWFEHDQGA